MYDVSEMWHGPGHLRFFIQPVVAILFGVRDGVRDAKEGRPPYLLAVITERHRTQRLQQGLRQIAVPLAIGVVLDLILQYVILRAIHVIAALLFGTVFIAVPYMIARALANRVVRRSVHRRAEAH